MHIITLLNEVMIMVTMTLAVPERMKQRMEEFPEINWSEVARQAIRQKIRDLEFLQRFKAQSTLTEEEAIELGAELNRKLARHYVEG